MGISNIGIYSNVSSMGAYNQRLTQATRQKLEELGIPYKADITEQEAKNLINRYVAMKANQSNKEGFSQGNGEQNSLMERLKELAEKLGINVEHGADFNKLIKEVEMALETKVQSSKNDIDELQNLKSLSQELASIQAQTGGNQMNYNSSNQALMMSLEMLSQYNRNFFNK